MKIFHRSLVASAALTLAACATTAPPTPVALQAPAAWQAPLPHQGSLQALAQWWTRLNDPLLVELIASAQTVSPGLAQAQSRVAQARASHVASRAALCGHPNAYGPCLGRKIRCPAGGSYPRFGWRGSGVARRTNQDSNDANAVQNRSKCSCGYGTPCRRTRFISRGRATSPGAPGGKRIW